MHHFLGLYPGERFVWHDYGESKRDGAGVTITFNADHHGSRGSPRRREALIEVATHLTQARIPWFELRGDKWFVDLGKLRASFQSLSDFEWLTGSVVIEPEFHVEDQESLGRPRKIGVVRLIFTPDTLQELTETDPQRRARVFDDCKFHPELIGKCRQLFIDGYLRQSALDGCTRVNELVRAKSGLQKDGFALVTEAFSKDTPVLKVNALQTNDDKNEQQGWMFLFGGMNQALRNPSAHTTDARSDELPVLDEIGFLSMLLRKLDQSSL